ncbi:hypothetical protein ACFE04_021361 [Oxalis oulophora]
MKPAIYNVSENDNACVKDSPFKKNEHEIAGVIEEMHEDNLRKSSSDLRYGMHLFFQPKSNMCSAGVEGKSTRVAATLRTISICCPAYYCVVLVLNDLVLSVKTLGSS